MPLDVVLAAGEAIALEARSTDNRGASARVGEPYDLPLPGSSARRGAPAETAQRAASSSAARTQRGFQAKKERHEGVVSPGF